MRIQYASDLHLEWEENFAFVMDGGLEAAGDCLVLAGDIAPLAWLDDYRAFWDWCSKNFALTIFVPGNHDYYGRWKSLRKLQRPVSIDIRPNVLCRSNQSVWFGSTEFVCSTLWTHVPPQDETLVQVGMPDYRFIQYRDMDIPMDLNILPEDTNHWHAGALSFLKRTVAASAAESIVVVTHHVPSFALCPPEQLGSPLQNAFYAELGNWIADSRINAWIYGHSHIAGEERIGQTVMLSNPLGYLNLKQGKNFEDGKILLL